MRLVPARGAGLVLNQLHSPILAIDEQTLVGRLACQLNTKSVILERRTTLSVQVSLTATAGNDSLLDRRDV